MEHHRLLTVDKERHDLLLVWRRRAAGAEAVTQEEHRVHGVLHEHQRREQNASRDVQPVRLSENSRGAC